MLKRQHLFWKPILFKKALSRINENDIDHFDKLIDNLIENKINQIASGLLLVAGILMLILHLLVGIDDLSEVVWIVPFVLSLVDTVILGIFHLRSEA